MGDQSHIDEMRAAVRADFERARARREAERVPGDGPPEHPLAPPPPPEEPQRPALIRRLAALFR